MKNPKITTLFCDIGGVLLTNGWDRHTRANAAEQFGFDLKEFEERHQLCFYLFEIGKTTLKEYLDETIFHQKRNFSMDKFIEYMHSQSQPFEDMIEYIKNLKQAHDLKVVLLSNEGRELSDYRIKTFALQDCADIFVVSGYVYLRKPDKYIFKMAIDLVQKSPESIIFIDDRQMFVDIANKMGLHGIRHLDLKTTKQAVERLTGF